MSFWGATVITSLASALPVVGNPLVSWLWGGLSVENATLNRFLSLHYLLPFIIAGNSVVHLAALHQYGSNHPLAVLIAFVCSGSSGLGLTTRPLGLAAMPRRIPDYPTA